MSECFYSMFTCGEMERLQMEGGEDEDGLIKCYSVTPVAQSPSTSQEGMCSAGSRPRPGEQTVPVSLCQLPPR